MNDFKELFEYSNSIMQLDLLLENEEIDGQTYEDSLELIKSSFTDNVDNLTRYNIHLLSRIDECKKYIEQLENNKKKLLKKHERLQKFLIDFMNKSNFEKISGNTSEIKIRKNKSVNIFDINKIPNAYKNQKIEFVPDKSKIKQAILAGENIEGAELKVNSSLSFK